MTRFMTGDGFSTVAGDWELHWAPYDPATYQMVLEQLLPDDVVLDIGAGDLRLARLGERVENLFVITKLG